MNVFFFGLGFSSTAAAAAIRDLVDPSAKISGTSRSPEGAARLAAKGFDAHIFTGQSLGPTLGDSLRAATHVVLSIAPDADGDAVLNHHRADLDAAQSLQWLCYYSTVGVYGDFGGEWVDESAPCQPVNKRSQQRVLAEAAWRDYAAARGLPLIILRLAGIYGPGRSTFDKLADGTARRIVKPGQVFNRIHVADIGRVTALAAQQTLAGTFNLADDLPAPPQDLVTYAADLMGISPPPELPFDTADLTPMARSFYSDNKRVSNRAIKAALGVDLLYPNYKIGLKALQP